jgi:23S rRNA (uridine2552-2'-O)-methyltransferase
MLITSLITRFISKDHYFEKAKSQGFKARSIFKLEEIDRAYGLIKPDSVVLDLGCAPGSWLQYVANKLGSKGVALGVDLSPIKENFHARIKTVVDDCFLLTDEKIHDYMKGLVSEFKRFDVVLSDMAPKTSGIKHVDQIRSLELAQKALSIAEQFLKTGGHVVIKVFGGGEVHKLIARMKNIFKTVKHVRPKSVRTQSKEFYVVGIHKK